MKYLENKIKEALLKYEAEKIWIVWETRKNILYLEYEEDGDYTTIESYAGSYEYNMEAEYLKIAEKYGVNLDANCKPLKEHNI